MFFFGIFFPKNDVEFHQNFLFRLFRSKIIFCTNKASKILIKKDQALKKQISPISQSFPS